VSAYVIVDIEVKDPVEYDAYRKLAPATVALYGGKYLARGGEVRVFEGDWTPHRLVVLEFSDLDRAKAWLDSPEYGAVKSMRHRAAVTNMVAIAGVE
jgi:uncharacterized protein (DUF1330 family)